MRPIDKGQAPDVYTNYKDAAPDLKRKLGEYCNYCGRRFETHLAVEHVQPQSDCPELVNEWSNFLLSCFNCNSCKLDTPVNLSDYLWPHIDNTLRALEYTQEGFVLPNTSLSAQIQEKAQKTIELLGLDKHPDNLTRKPTLADFRWLKRKQIWKLAEECQVTLNTNNSPETRDLIAEVALARGIFSIWWTVFKHDLEMKRRLRELFIGTDQNSFHTNEELKPRAGGQV